MKPDSIFSAYSDYLDDTKELYNDASGLLKDIGKSLEDTKKYMKKISEDTKKMASSYEAQHQYWVDEDDYVAPKKPAQKPSPVKLPNKYDDYYNPKPVQKLPDTYNGYIMNGGYIVKKKPNQKFPDEYGLEPVKKEQEMTKPKAVESLVPYAPAPAQIPAPAPAIKAKYIVFSSKKTFGIELEVNKKVSQKVLQDAIAFADLNHKVHTSGYGKSKNNNYWHVKTDSTCGNKGYGNDDGGWEIASFVAKGFRDLSSISNVVRSIEAAGAEVNNNCGFHIHCSVTNEKSFLNTVLNWIRIEHIILEMVPEHRKNNVYCKPLFSKLKAGELACSLYDVRKKITSNCSQYNDRRTTLNVYNFFYNDLRTLELRLPEGTVNHNVVKHWIRLFVHFVTVSGNNAKKIADCDTKLLSRKASLLETLQILGLHGTDEFYILSAGLAATKSWFLKRIIKYSTNKALIEEAKGFLKKIS